MSILVQVSPRQPIRLLIRASHDRVSAEAAPDVPDPVERWAAAVSAGLLGRDESGDPPKAAITHHASEGPDVHWAVLVEHYDPRALTPLANLLRARYENVYATSDLDRGELTTVFDFERVGPPRAPSEMPFALEADAPSRATRDRGVTLSLSSRPDDALLDEIIVVLDLWADLMSLGGFPTPGDDPARCTVSPNGAIASDEYSVSQSFEDGFFADPVAFEAVINYSIALTQRGVRVATLYLR